MFDTAATASCTASPCQQELSTLSILTLVSKMMTSILQSTNIPMLKRPDIMHVTQHWNSCRPASFESSHEGQSIHRCDCIHICAGQE